MGVSPGSEAIEGKRRMANVHERKLTNVFEPQPLTNPKHVSVDASILPLVILVLWSADGGVVRSCSHLISLCYPGRPSNSPKR